MPRIFLILATALLALTWPATAADGPPGNWIVGEAVAPASGTGFRIRLSADYEMDAGDFVEAVGWNVQRSRWLFASLSSAPSMSSGVTAGPFVFESSAEETSQRTGTLTRGVNFFQSNITAGEVVRFIVILPEARITGGHITVEVEGITATGTVTTGSGAGVLRLTDPGFGAVVSEDGVLRGSMTRLVQLDEASVAMPVQWTCLDRCEVTWVTPEGRSGSYHQSRYSGGGNGAPESGPGLWAFSWYGVARDDAFILHAPVAGKW